jgi:hypothetical protein
VCAKVPQAVPHPPSVHPLLPHSLFTPHLACLISPCTRLEALSNASCDSFSTSSNDTASMNCALLTLTVFEDGSVRLPVRLPPFPSSSRLPHRRSACHSLQNSYKNLSCRYQLPQPLRAAGTSSPFSVLPIFSAVSALLWDAFDVTLLVHPVVSTAAFRCCLRYTPTPLFCVPAIVLSPFPPDTSHKSAFDHFRRA